MNRVALFPLMLLTACAVGPDFSSPPPPAPRALGPQPLATVEALGGTQRFQSDIDIPTDWWQWFKSPTLDALVSEALAQNADLAAAQAALRQAQELASANQGLFYPAITGTAQAVRQKDPTGSVAPTAANNQPLLNLFTPQVAVTYGPDLWGGNRRAQEGLDAARRGAAMQAEATRLVLAGNVVVTAISEAGLREQIAATERMVVLARQTLDITTHQVALGQNAETDRLAQQAALAQLEQAVPPLRRQRQALLDQLTALLGRLPADAPRTSLLIDEIALPTDLPQAVPSRLVGRRPDIRVADANLQMASSQIGVAIADRLPALTLGAALGSSATSLNELFTPGTGLWSLGGGITLPIFAGGTLLHKERAARAAYEQAAAQYRSTVITAFQNVVDCLVAQTTDAEQLKAAESADQAAQQGLTIAGHQLTLGDVGPLTVMAAEQIALGARVAVTQARTSRLTDTVALIVALGGGAQAEQAANE